MEFSLNLAKDLNYVYVYIVFLGNVAFYSTVMFHEYINPKDLNYIKIVLLSNVPSNSTPLTCSKNISIINDDLPLHSIGYMNDRRRYL